jgi:hypothetical protein
MASTWMNLELAAKQMADFGYREVQQASQNQWKIGLMAAGWTSKELQITVTTRVG